MPLVCLTGVRLAACFRLARHWADGVRAAARYQTILRYLWRIVATTELDNAASIAVMRRLGMRIERNPYSQPERFQIVGILEETTTY